MADDERIRRFLSAYDIVAQADRLDEYRAEIRRTQPQNAHYDTWGLTLQIDEMARRIPADFGTMDERRAAVVEHYVGSAGKTALKAIETIAAEVIEDRRRKPAEPEEDPQEEPPEPPADWRSECQGQEPIVIKTAAEAPACVRLAKARKAAGK